MLVFLVLPWMASETVFLVAAVVASLAEHTLPCHMHSGFGTLGSKITGRATQNVIGRSVPVLQKMKDTSLGWETLQQFDTTMTPKCMILLTTDMSCWTRSRPVRMCSNLYGELHCKWYQVLIVTHAGLGVNLPWIKGNYIYTPRCFTIDCSRRIDVEEACVSVCVCF